MSKRTVCVISKTENMRIQDVSVVLGADVLVHLVITERALNWT